MNSSFTLSLVKKQLKTNAEHIFLKNFNLHYFIWCDSTWFTQYVVITQLIKLMKNAELNLILSENMMIWQMKNRFFIIDFVFMSKHLKKKLIHCDVKSNFNQSFDHILIFMNILLNNIWTKLKRTRAWKKIDVMKLKKLCEKIFIFSRFIDVEKIETYAKSLQNWLCKIMKKMISWKRSHELFKSYWDKKCNEAVNTFFFLFTHWVHAT